MPHLRKEQGGLDRERTAEENQAYLERVDTADEPVAASFGNIGRTFKERSEFWIKLEQCEQKPGLHVVRADRSRDWEFWTRVIAHRDAGEPIPEVVEEALRAAQPVTRKLNDPNALELIAFLRAMGLDPRQSRRRGPKALVLSPARGGRVQTRIIAELPPELTPEQRVQVVKAFCAEFEQLGLPYWAVIHAPDRHNDERNFHVHIALSERPAQRMLNPATGVSCWDFEILVETRDKKQRPHIRNKCVVLRGRSWPGIQRERWAKAVNDACSQAGLELRFDPRTYKEQGIEQEPRPRLSTGVFAREREGEVTEKGLAAAQAQWRERVRWAAETTLAVEKRLTALEDRLCRSPRSTLGYGPALLANVVRLGERVVRETREVLAAEYVRERLISRLRLRRTHMLTPAEREVMNLASTMEADNSSSQARLHRSEQEWARSVELAEAWLMGAPEDLEVNVRSEPDRLVSGPDEDPASSADTTRESSPLTDPQAEVAVEDLGTEMSGVEHRTELSGSNSPTQQRDGRLGNGWSDHSTTPLAIRGLLDRVARGENVPKPAGPEAGGLQTLTGLSDALRRAGQVLNISTSAHAVATGALAQSGEDLASGLTNQAEVTTVVVGSGKPSATFTALLGWPARISTSFAPFRVEGRGRGPGPGSAPEDQPSSENASEDRPVLTGFSSEPNRDLGTATRDEPDRDRDGAHDRPASPGVERKQRAASDLATTSAKAQPPQRGQDFSESSLRDASMGATGPTTACSVTESELAKASPQATSVIPSLDQPKTVDGMAVVPKSTSEQRGKGRPEEDDDAAFHRNGKASPADLRRYKMPGMFEVLSKETGVPRLVIDPRGYSEKVQLAICAYLDVVGGSDEIARGQARARVFECVAPFNATGIPQKFAGWVAEFPAQAAEWRSGRLEITRHIVQVECASQNAGATAATLTAPPQSRASDEPSLTDGGTQAATAADVTAADQGAERAALNEGQAPTRKQIGAYIESWREPRRRSIATFLSAIHEKNLPLRNAAARLSDLDSNHLRFLKTWSEEDPVGAELLVRRFKPLTFQEVLRELRSRGIGE
jgi:hypothetical protein